MKKLKILIFLCLFLGFINSNAQDSISVPDPIDKTSAGIGAGIDYGGFGANMLVYTNKSVGLFGGVGYALAGIGFNAGAKYRFVSKKQASVDPFVLAMYGYNASITVKNATQYNKLFYGPSFGIGIDFRSGRMKNGYWSMALLVPVRSSSVNEYIDDLKENHGVEFENELIPVALSIGYRFVLN